MQELLAAGANQGLIEAGALGDGYGPGALDPATHINLQELGTEVGLASLEQLFPQHLWRLGNTHNIAIEQADVLAFIAFGDQGEEVEGGS